MFCRNNVFKISTSLIHFDSHFKSLNYNRKNQEKYILSNFKTGSVCTSDSNVGESTTGIFHATARIWSKLLMIKELSVKCPFPFSSWFLLDKHYTHIQYPHLQMHTLKDILRRFQGAVLLFTCWRDCYDTVYFSGVFCKWALSVFINSFRKHF